MAASQIPLPGAMDCSNKDLVVTWKQFREGFEIYEIATDLTAKDEKKRVATLKIAMGKECLNILKHLDMSEEDGKSVSKILDALSRHFTPQPNIVYERYLFFTRDQAPNELIDTYVNSLKELATSCKFGRIENELIRDRLVVGCADCKVRERMFRDRELTLTSAWDMCRSAEITKAQLAKMRLPEATGEVNFAKGSNKSQHKHGNRITSAKKKDYSEKGSLSYQSSGKGKEKKIRGCAYCGGDHIKGKCPAYGKKCRKCGRNNHFASSCRSVNYVQHNSDSEDSVFTVKSRTANSWSAEIHIAYSKQEEEIKCQLDTGATCDIISVDDAKRIMCKYYDERTRHVERMTLYDGSTMPSVGRCTLNLRYKDRQCKADFKIVESRQRPLLSGDTCVKLGLIKRINCVTFKPLERGDIMEEYADLFTGLGCLPGVLHLDIDAQATPVQHQPRKMAVAIRDRVKQKLTEMEARGIIAQMSEPSEWISSMVVVKKPSGDLRICIDPKDLNSALQRARYPLPTIDDVLPKLTKARVFSVCDAKEAFWQVKLDEASSKLTCFWTPFGRYRWLRMPYGIGPASEEFQRRLHEAMEGLDGTAIIADDVLVYGSGDTDEEASEDHDRNLRKFLDRARMTNLKLNPNKMRLRLPQVRFMGHMLSKDGLRPDPEKVKAVEHMPKPTDVAGVRRYIGFVNYLSRFLPQLSEIAEPLRQLMNDGAEFAWLSAQEDAWQRIKDIVITTPVLRYYDLEKEVTVQADASEKGIGCALLQEGQPVAYASRTLSTTEQNYAQIEKECLAIMWACEHFDSYIHGREMVTVETDHKPLEMIFKKPIVHAPKRLQRMMLRLQKYQIVVTYKRGVEMYIADTLSRAMLPPKKMKDIPEIQVFTVMQEKAVRQELECVNPEEFLRVSPNRLSQIQTLTRNDATLQCLITVVMSGWPDYRDQVPVCIRPYFGYRDEIAVHNGVVYKGDRVVIPRDLRKEMLKRIHSSHQGIEACTRRARDVLYWPGMSAEIKEAVQQCNTCAENASSQNKEPLLSHLIAERPWQKVAMDLFTLNKKDYLVTVDLFSDYWEVDRVTDTTSSKIIKVCKANFARHGIPDEVLTDNGPQFSSTDFKTFAHDWEFVHTTSSPHYPKSNGKAESAVKIVKSLIRKATQDGKDVWLAILEHRNTPTEAIGSSPVQRLMSRRTRTLVPTAAEQLKPMVEQGVPAKINQKRNRAKFYHDRTAVPLAPLDTGESVRIRSPVDGSWKPGVCTEQVAPRSYVVQLNNKNYRRNRRDIRKDLSVPQDTEIDSTEMDDTSSRQVDQPEIDKPPDSPPSVVPLTVATTQKTGTKSTRTRHDIRPPARYRDT